MYYIVAYSYLFLPICFFLFKGKVKNKIFPVLAIYGLLFCGWLIYYKESPKDIRQYLQIFYTFLEYSIFTFVFWQVIKSKKFKIFILTTSIFFIAFQIYFTTVTPFLRLDSIPVGIETILLFIYIFYFFYEFSKQTKDVFIYNHYLFWIAVGIMIYLGGSFFFYILINHLDHEEVEKFGNMTYVAEVLKNMLFCIAIYIYSKSPLNKIQKTDNIPNLDMI